MPAWQKQILLKSAGLAMRRQLRRNLQELGPDMVEDLRHILGRPQPPSQPDYPPHVKKGFLKDSIDWSYEETPGVMQVHVGSDHEHAVFTEFGLRYDERPWLRPFFGGMDSPDDRISKDIDNQIIFPVLFHGF